MIIPAARAGEYQVRIFREGDAIPGDTYTMGIRVDGNTYYYPIEDRNVPTVGVSHLQDWVAALTFAGDANADGVVNSQDIILLVNYSFKSGPPPVIPAHGDVNCDGFVNSQDIIYLVNFTFKSAAAPCSQSAQ